MPDRWAHLARVATLALALAGGAATATDTPPSAIEQTVPGTRWIVVVAEGTGEPRSIGSYSLRVYVEPEVGGRLDRFVAGAIKSRDGTLEALRFTDLDRDGGLELVVTLRSVGTGAYLSADAWRLRDGVPRLVASVEGLPRDEDPLPALAATLRSRAR
jgi:hypothetical protein